MQRHATKIRDGHPAGLRLLSAELADKAEPRSAMAYIPQPMFLPTSRPLRKPWGKLIAHAIVLGVSLVGIAAGVAVIAEMVNG